MATLIPAHAAGNIVEGITEYLTSTFSLADQETSTALKHFLGDSDTGMFHGPYVRSRLPYQQAHDWEGLLSFLPPTFVPYHHQAEAFRRLHSRDEQGPRRPEPTLVVTGTGSGKTESFLYPILDHAARMRAQGQRGVKALLLYPMNALANDQADRLAKLIAENKELAGVTAGIYTGETSGSKATRMSEKSLITDREVLRQDPPDLLLTNYKMLDQLLLRTRDREIWQHSATSLQYLVLDEFHSYDGAQGTDVALLLRRLGMQLKKLQPEGFLDDVAAARPLGQITPVATSATLGSDESFDSMLGFARTIFGETFPGDAVVSETLLPLEGWRSEMARDFGSPTSVGHMPAKELVEEVNRRIAEHPGSYADVVFEVFCEAVWGCAPELGPAITHWAAHPLTGAILEHAGTAVPLIRREGDDVATLPDLVLGTTARQVGETVAAEFITHALTAFAYLRARAGDEDSWKGKRLPGVETHLWVREVSRIDRALAAEDQAHLFRWSDDGPTAHGDDGAAQWLPACYCRNCGRSGWMTALEPGTDTPVLDGAEIRKTSISEQDRGRQRPLLDATPEYRAATSSGQPVARMRDSEGDSAVMWLHAGTGELSMRQPTPDEEDSGMSVPVLTHAGPDADEYAADQRCPSCGEDDSIRYIGSRVSTLLSVALSNYFGMPDLDSQEKKTLIFTDSVQDAAHRAGFVQSRSRAFALRTFTRRAVGSATVELSLLTDRLMDQAGGDPRARYELLPPGIVEFPGFKGYWHLDASDAERREAFREVRRRLSFDLALEFGQRANLPRSLALTGAVSVGVEVSPQVARSAAADALAEVAALSFDALDAARQQAWVQGVLEMVRSRGGINHEWFRSYLADDGNAYQLNKRDSRARGVPGFPRGGSPEFPRVGPALSAARRDSGTTTLSSPRGRFADWTAKVLGGTRHDAATAVTALFTELARRDVLTTVPTKSGGTIYALEPDRVLVAAEAAPAYLECDICHVREGVAAPVRTVLEGQHCFTPGCTGVLRQVASEENYYRDLYDSPQPRTVIAREHTSLLDKKKRLALENSFRSSDDKAPDAPNVLVATPTLEMGIDIGDLSSVMLASLPTSVASYVQRVGRAGRLTGNSLVLALVQGRGTTLPKLNQPLSVISGAVAPPVAFLSATEILHRQFTAYLVDCLDTAILVPDLQTARDVFDQSGGEPSLVDVITDRIRAGVDDLLDEFIAALGAEVDQDSTAQLRGWATGEDPESLIGQLHSARHLWDQEMRELLSRQVALGSLLDDLDARGENLDDDLKEDKRTVTSALRHVRAQLRSTGSQHWIGSLERYGILPNFTLLDDSVELDVAVSVFNPSTLEFNTESYEYSRGVSSALHELAPGSTFYAQGIAAQIDSVEIGHQGAAIEQWRLCPVCSHSEIAARAGVTSAPAGACPVCGEAGFADKGQLIDVVPMRKVAAEVEQTRAVINDSSEERYTARFHVLPSFTIPEGGTGASWYLSEGFGAQHLRQVDLRWLNLGQGSGQKKLFAGRECDTPLFRVCRYCGHSDSEAGTNSKWDHRPWCSHRNAADEDTVSFALGRTLRTQGVLLLLPELFTSAADTLTVPSLIAALRLGFKEVLGGDPDHLAVLTLQVARTGGQAGAVDALLLHDTIPGGTGYLSQFTRPEKVRELLEKAWQKVSSCECAGDERLACPHCLLPYAGRPVESTSRTAAERALAMILLNDSRPDPDADPLAAPAWDVMEHRPATPEGSQLELEFRIRLRQALSDRHATFVEGFDGGLPLLDITMPNGTRWRMSEQRDFGYTRPDFFFEPLSGHHRPVAVFTDGYAYHASEAHFRVHEDVAKRSQLIDAHGILPWALTAADLDLFASGDRTPPVWYHEEGHELAAQSPVLDQSALELMYRPQMDILLAYLADPEASQWSEYAHSMATHLVKHGGRPSDTGVTAVFRGNIECSVVAVNRAIRARELTLNADTAADLSKETWNIFLNLANLMWLADSGNTTVTTSLLAHAEQPVAEESDVEKQVLEISPAWQETLEEFEGEGAVEDAIRTLATAGARSTDVLGEELESLPTVLIWPAEKIALLYERAESDASGEAELRSSGWTLIHSDDLSPATIPAQLLAH